jgi:hypothetical protein
MNLTTCDHGKEIDPQCTKSRYEVKMVKIIQVIQDVLKSPQFLGIIITALIAVFTFYQTEKNKLKWEQYKCKEQSYADLIKSVSEF